MIQTARCDLTQLEQDDFENVAELRTDAAVRQYLGGPVPKQQIRSDFSAMLASDSSVHLWPVREKANAGLLT